uniref:Enhancer of split M1 protein n=1 Tax=Drosophila rhopaloa TaxID=1041015 RepID=A0A6P4EE18_DRORH
MISILMTLCLFLLSVQIEAQTRSGCPDICPAVYQPVCGKTLINGKSVKCEFSNGCFMGGSSCRHNIRWTKTSLKECVTTDPICRKLR